MHVGESMPDKRTLDRVARDKREGKSAGTQAGEFVREEIHHIRDGKHGARSAKQAIAIGLSKARRAGVVLPVSAHASPAVRKRAAQETASAHDHHQVSHARSVAMHEALEHEPHAAASHLALSRHAHAAASHTTAAQRHKSALTAARTRARGAKPR